MSGKYIIIFAMSLIQSANYLAEKKESRWITRAILRSLVQTLEICITNKPAFI